MGFWLALDFSVVLFRSPPPVSAAAPPPATEAPSDDVVGRLLDPEDSVRVVRHFYQALGQGDGARAAAMVVPEKRGSGPLDRKSTRLNSSHSQISHAVFC